MPRDIDHIVATHRLAQERRDAGLPIRTHTLDVSDLFCNDALTFVDRRDAVVQRLESSPWYQQCDNASFEEFAEAVAGLSSANDTAEFDEYWARILWQIRWLYDFANGDRARIKTR